MIGCRKTLKSAYHMGVLKVSDFNLKNTLCARGLYIPLLNEVKNMKYNFLIHKLLAKRMFIS